MLNRTIALLLLIIFSPIIFLLYLLILIIDGNPAFFKQRRFCQNNTNYLVYKFRTMGKNLGDIPTHLIKDPINQLSRMGPFLRRFSLDEIPQLINVIRGEMVFIGPRPALHNQVDLIQLRTDKGLHKLKPGITGWAQVNGRDKLSIKEKVALEEYYLNHKSLSLDLKIILMTLFQLLFPTNVSH